MQALENIGSTLNNDYEERFNSVKAVYKFENIAKDKLYYNFFNLDSAYSSTRSLLLETKSAEAASVVIEDFISYAYDLSSASSLNERTIKQFPSTNYIEFGMMELAIAAKKAIGEMAMMIGATDVKFDDIRALVVHSGNDIRLGQTLSGKLYFAAVTSRDIPGAVFLLNEDTLVSNGGYADFSYKPKMKGQQTLKFEIRIDESAPIGLSHPVQETLDIVVK